MARLNFGKRFQNGSRVSATHQYDPVMDKFTWSDAPTHFAPTSPKRIAQCGNTQAVLKIRRERKLGALVREREAVEELALAEVQNAIMNLQAALDILAMAPNPNAKFIGRVRQKALVDAMLALKNKAII